MSLVAAAIASLVVCIAGLISDVRIGTILLRCLGGFLVTGLAVWLIAFVLEAKEIVGFDANIEMSEPDEGGREAERAETDAEGQAESGEKGAVGEKAAEEFTPLADSLRRMEAPSES